MYKRGHKKQLEDRIKRVSSKVAVQGCSIRLLKSRQQLGLKAIAPYGIPVEGGITDRNAQYADILHSWVVFRWRILD